jgi:hypothetical protein
MTEDRRAWKFEPGMQPEYRQALALEFIAYYLDRMDLQLTRVADVAEKNQVNLAAIAEQMPR